MLAQTWDLPAFGPISTLAGGMNTRAPKVLLVDDDLLIREIYGHHLEGMGFEVLQARNGNEAFEVAKRECPQVIVLDINMPEASGLAGLRDLKAHETTRPIPVIMITSAVDSRTCREFATAGDATAFLTKPFAPKQLLAEIQRALQPDSAKSGAR